MSLCQWYSKKPLYAAFSNNFYYSTSLQSDRSLMLNRHILSLVLLTLPNPPILLRNSHFHYSGKRMHRYSKYILRQCFSLKLALILFSVYHQISGSYSYKIILIKEIYKDVINSTVANLWENRFSSENFLIS